MLSFMKRRLSDGLRVVYNIGERQASEQNTFVLPAFRTSSEFGATRAFRPRSYFLADIRVYSQSNFSER